MMISVKNITKSYKNNLVLDNVSINFDAKINFLLGDNGEGKTTVINILAGIVKLNKGNIFINNKKMTYSDGTYKKNIGFVLNLPTYPFQFKVKEYIDLLNSIYMVNIEKNCFYQEELLDFFDLNKYLDYKISELSTGYVKRVKLFASMLHKPMLYIYDEPFAGLDKNFIPKLVNKVIELSNQGSIFLITTHSSSILSFDFPNSTKFNISNGKILKAQ